MMRFNENADLMIATAYAVTMGIADQFRSSRFRSRFAETTLFMNYDLLRPNEQASIDRIAARALEGIRLGDIADLRCEIDYYRDEEENIYITFRTGIEDYGLTMSADGNGWFGRIRTEAA